MNENQPAKLPETLYMSGTMMDGQSLPGWTGFITLQWDGSAWVASTRVITLAAETPT
jgi:hypothetical protein